MRLDQVLDPRVEFVANGLRRTHRALKVLIHIKQQEYWEDISPQSHPHLFINHILLPSIVAVLSRYHPLNLQYLKVYQR